MNLPRLFGAYLLYHKLGEGSVSEVYLARTTGEFPRLCVVKVILPTLAALPDFSERFRKDAALLVRLIHGNLVQVLEVGIVDEQPFVAMEQIDGVDLPTLIEQVPDQGLLPPELGLYVGIELCEAVTYVHLRRREVVRTTTFPHDHPWPFEVMLSFDGVVKLIDLGAFGAVRLGQQKVALLFRCPGYGVPEVILRRPLDARSDVFALGVVVWELLEGRRLLLADPEAYVRQVLSGTFRAPLLERKDLPGEVIRLVASMLSLDPDKRPSQVEEVRRIFVGGLRRLSPTYGSASLAQLLWRRCKVQIARHEALMDELSQYVGSGLPTMPEAKTLSLGRAGVVDREIRESKPLKPGDQIPGTRYRVVRPLGSGGSAEVHAAQHIDLERQVAIKILSPRLARSTEAISQFRMEARACSRVSHPNIIDVVDFGELEDGRFYFAMELLDGESLSEVIEREGTLAPGRCIGIFRQIARALSAAHQQGIIHRDLKPENVVLVERESRRDFVKVLDFGVGAFEEGTAGARVGTTGYMAPEQVAGARPTPAMDIYALGASLYQALSGELPYPGSTPEEYSEAQAKNPPPALRSRPTAMDAPPALERVVHRALERDPLARHRSMAEFELDLLRAQKEAGLETPWDDLPEPGQDGARRSRRGPASEGDARPPLPLGRFVAAAGAVLISVAAVVAIIVLASGRPGLVEVRERRSDSGSRAGSTVRRVAAAPPAKRPPLPAAARADAAAAAPDRAVPPRSPDASRPRDQGAPDVAARVADAAASDADAEPVPPPDRAGKKAGKKKAAAKKPAKKKPAKVAKARRAKETKRLVDEGRKLLQSGKAALAQKKFQTALQADPASLAAVLGLAQAALEQSQYSRAIEHSRKAIALSPKNVQAHMLLGDAAYNLLRHEDARKAWTKVLEIDPKNEKAKRRLSKLK
jgi:eukaryotic-like serine/threonine-protein kinase